MRHKLFLILFALVACNPVNKKVAQSTVSTSKYQTTLDSSIVKPIVSNCISNYMTDSSISKHKDLIRLLLIEFFYENEDTIFSISGHSVIPIIGPQNKSDGYEFQGFIYLNKYPVLFYDNKRGFGLEFYNANKLIKDTLKFDEYPENLVGLPKWLYKVDSKDSLILIRKISEFHLK
jgi:hypothetical protein